METYFSHEEEIVYIYSWTEHTFTHTRIYIYILQNKCKMVLTRKSFIFYSYFQ